MAARDISFADAGGKNKPVHHFHAEAHLISAELEHPLKESIRPQGAVKLPRDGHYKFRKADPYHFEGILSYRSGYTQVAGHPSKKTEGFATLSTSVVEGLNVLDVVTADRVVAQIATVHPIYGKGQVPSVTFLGTRFENLMINGYKVEVDRGLEILGPKPASDQSYFENRDVLDRISEQYERIATAKDLPEWGAKEFPQSRPASNGELSCSLVKSIKGSPVSPFGHVIDLPHFGRIYLGELKLIRKPGDKAKGIYDTYKFQLTMVRMQMGCVGDGGVGVGIAVSNGQGSGDGGHSG
ncbi:MAG: hypothetical protein WBS24_11040 [Terriglobales bacterium]